MSVDTHGLEVLRRSAEDIDGYDQYIKMSTVDASGSSISVQNPLPCDGDSVYTKDVWLDESDIGDFSGSITDLFDNLHTVISNTTSNNPKGLTIHFNRTIPLLAIGLGAYAGNFSNLKVIGLTTGHVETILHDASTDNTKKTTQTLFVLSGGHNAIKLQFHTTDTVTLSNLFILKAIGTVARIQGQKPNGDFTEFQSTAAGNFKGSIEEIESGVVLPVSLPASNFDSFGRFSTASPHKLIEYGATYPIDEVRYHSLQVTAAGTAVRDATKTQIEFSTSTVSGDKVTMQTRRNVQYNKANAQEIFVIYRPNPIANRRERWGYFDDNNGVFFEHDGTTAKVVVRSNTSGSPVDLTFEQSTWDDPLDGTGASGLTIDWTKQSVFKIDFGWLSSRGCRYWIDCQGVFVLVKQYYISNTLTFPFMATAMLPIRFEVENTGTVASGTTSSFSCYAVQSSGSKIQEGPIRVISTGATTKPVTTTETAIGGIRLNSNFPNASLQPEAFKLLPATGTDNIVYRVYYNPTLVDDVWVTGESGVFDKLASVTSFSGGSVITEGHMAMGTRQTTGDVSSIELLSDIYIGRDLDGSMDALILTVQSDTGTGTLFQMSEFKEYT